jgi:hypothetical protein
MAILDSRLIPLTETLAAADADWLAFELLDGLRQGRVLEETHDELRKTQIAVRSARRPTRSSEEPSSPPPAAEPIVGDDQIEWAAAYVSSRLSDAVSMLQTTLDQLDEIVSGAPTLDQPFEAAPSQEGVTLVLQVGDEVPRVRRVDAADARAALPKLQEALRAWVASTRKSTNDQ